MQNVECFFLPVMIAEKSFYVYVNRKCGGRRQIRYFSSVHYYLNPIFIGWKVLHFMQRKNCKQWMEYLHSLFGDDRPKFCQLQCVMCIRNGKNLSRIPTQQFAISVFQVFYWFDLLLNVRVTLKFKGIFEQDIHISRTNRSMNSFEFLFFLPIGSKLLWIFPHSGLSSPKNPFYFLFFFFFFISMNPILHDTLIWFFVPSLPLFMAIWIVYIVCAVCSAYIVLCNL